MTYAEAIDFLYRLRWFGAKFGLDNTLQLARLAGNPHHHLRFIHVAGTNGKGSTCAMLEAIYRTAGLRVGLFTSPHLIAFGERIQVNRLPLPEHQTVELIRRLQPLLATFPTEHHPTFFEVVVVMAFLHFLEQKCDLVVLETGLGGRLDATNIVTPLASVITNIQFDHQKWLGSSLASIAAEKAGILKPGVPAITGTQHPEPLAVIRATAAALHCPLTEIDPRAPAEPPLDQIQLPLLGEHQRLNAAVALATVRVLNPLIPVAEKQAIAALSTVYWPGRLQVIPQPGGRTIVLDGAHNEGGARVLVDALRRHFPGQRPTLILGVLEDKDWDLMCSLLAPLAQRLLLVPVATERTANPHALATACRQANPDASVAQAASLPDALRQTACDPLVVIAGSLYLVGEALELLHLPATRPSERHLNDWTTTSQPSPQP